MLALRHECIIRMKIYNDSSSFIKEISILGSVGWLAQRLMIPFLKRKQNSVIRAGNEFF
jgi:hypothetical protein